MTEDVFVASSGTLALVSKNGQGLAADSDSFNPSVSGDGQAIVFESFATDLVTGSQTAGDRYMWLDTTSDWG